MSVKKRIFNKLSPLNKMRAMTLKHNIKASFTFPKKEFNGFADETSLPLNDFFRTNELRLSNDFYGIAEALKTYSGYKKRLSVFIEHGVYFGDYTNDEEICGAMPALITFSSTRASHINKKSDIEAVPIGPYIVYSKPFFNSEQTALLKEKYGKILLAFPQHSIEGINVNSDSMKFIDKLNAIKDDGRFNSVFVCLYYRELTKEAISLYKNMGFIPVCAGNRMDPAFLQRLRSFIELSDFTVSDNIGTHIGYCEALGKEHLVFNSGSSITAANKNSEKNAPELYLKSAVDEKDEVRRVFSISGNKKERDEILRKYWGTDYIMSPEKLNEILVFSRKVKLYSKKHKLSCVKAYEALKISKLTENKGDAKFDR